ncbi:hypothetical protein BATDEDRAFT_85737 [Batrachochytrium dendrobatidis JAM81]|uniref:Uncharacterized protein n=2 Tax=Batrachochytrium dendrobatidis TaxID=109871 RepID=F4NT25_BATDJ|nr:uncharacterized protein BATDEDRAFT_85737 [Batrachochytrium dendrobatidis JAM81]EGF83070.1 hypothetical protein BATDEDRAFT_85737 [Batrachochytrium dendrobatidis JAM81]KAJ8331454.1 hypothetical protein O5D80_000372 [Batrachochytrium dendrobatidis]KAK5671899.1 hypothetical protein QVD99_001725 [Batrachochytrium dendrobatidis]OAJ36100.1 hypothetical protein BDEG_20312 [Batrachochytrium dendrobatidis JEL423]|eukprot:XP_006675970.1 hypothetical protein BATDEDRAFT_85737 [Batrachochytrium dendrobatidis JAM81]
MANITSTQVFEQFLSYDFEKDERFTQGLQQAMGSVTTQVQDQMKLEQAKVFYFSKFIAPLDYAAYKKWQAATAREAQTRLDSTLAQGHLKQSKECLVEESDTTVDGETSHDLNETTLTFQEISERVARGEPIPGIRSIPDTVHEHRSKPALLPLKKPWE